MQKFEERISDVDSLLIEPEETEQIISRLVQNPDQVCEILINANAFKNEEHRKSYIDSLPKIEKRLQVYFENYCRKNNMESQSREYYVRIKGYYVPLNNLKAALSDEIGLSLYVESLPCTNKRTVKGLLKWEDKYNELRTNLSSAELQETIRDRDLPF